MRDVQVGAHGGDAERIDLITEVGQRVHGTDPHLRCRVGERLADARLRVEVEDACAGDQCFCAGHPERVFVQWPQRRPRRLELELAA